MERSIIGFQYQLFSSQRQIEETSRGLKEIQRLVFQIRDEEEWFGMVALSESDEADEARKQAEEAEIKAQRTRKEIEQLLGRWVNHGAGTKEILEPELEKPASVRSSAPG